MDSDDDIVPPLVYSSVCSCTALSPIRVLIPYCVLLRRFRNYRHKCTVSDEYLIDSFLERSRSVIGQGIAYEKCREIRSLPRAGQQGVEDPTECCRGRGALQYQYTSTY